MILYGLAQDEVRSTGENFGESARSVNTGFNGLQIHLNVQKGG